MVFCFLVLLLLGSSAVALLSKEPGRVSGTGSSSSSPSADEIALLSAKSALSDPSGSLASWNASTRLCTWRGVMCSRRHPGRIVALSIDSMGLGGRVSPFLGNLSFLRTLDLGNNYLVGPIPPELGRLGRLRLLNLSVNSLEGGIPAALGMCTQLTMLSLAANQLQGEIPSVVGSLHNLALLDLQMNNLSGEIPPSVANLSSLQALALTFNTFSGAIPPYLGRLPELSELYLAGTNLSGRLPQTLWNLSSLTALSVAGNNLTGTIPPNAFCNIPRIQNLYMSNNQFHGHIPSSIANASNLGSFSAGQNYLSGTLPSNIGGLQRLQRLVLSYNFLKINEPKDWNFMTALTNCSELLDLELDFNDVTGELPSSLSNLSTSLEKLALSGNQIFGVIPQNIGNLIALETLALELNNLTGPYLSLYNNNFWGDLQLIGNLTQLNYLYIGYNSFNGTVPNTLGNLKSLLEFDLSYNKLTGSIPASLLQIPTLSHESRLSHNLLEGPIPPEFGNLKSVSIFHAESNRLTGEIPSTLGECQLLQNLHLQNNFLSGTLPNSLIGLKNLEILDLSNNSFSGQIPKFLGNISTLIYLNISFNKFTGEVPTFGVFSNASAFSIHGNAKLCGGISDLHLPPCSSELSKKKAKKIPVTPLVVSVIATISVLSCLGIYLIWNKRRSTTSRNPSTAPMQNHPLITYSQLAKATEVLKLQTPGAAKSFIAECKVLRNIRHRNLVQTITACSSIDSKVGDRHLSLLQRVNILFDVAYALEYLHFNGPTPVVHCDLKPSNVLLDIDMVAHVGDFGLAKILADGCSSFQPSISSMGFRGTIGYAPPEYGAGSIVSTHGDIYSYGILVLEMITGRRPTDNTFDGTSGIHKYVEMAINNSVMDIIDMDMALELETIGGLSSKTRQINSLISLLHLGLLCSAEMPSNRISTKEVIKELHVIKNALVQGEVSGR
ncbi:hypothetical protein HU200_067767 [Digitaria exilis]|uniref:non-specific serine/threonine protein kinase n=1 Tax=Digitaria exilis TaxID=1010633 RepID=A0A835A4I7_9POAL|nr:hypothetical protein HU200_067767 [Digitaria exilis]